MATRILIVAEIRLYRDGLESSLQARGYDVLATAASARDALGALAVHRVDVVLVDMVSDEGWRRRSRPRRAARWSARRRSPPA
jgi:DNA-binding NarL/FixJ family response regulator